MPPFAANNRTRARLRLLADESRPSRLPPPYAVLTGVSDRRRKRALHALQQAEHNDRCARTRLQAAEIEAMQLQDRLHMIERDWHRRHRGHGMLCRALHHARAAQIQREALVQRQATHVLALKQDCARAACELEAARERHGRLARKAERVRALRQRIEIAGDK
jgi:hypothetical protein